LTRSAGAATARRVAGVVARHAPAADRIVERVLEPLAGDHHHVEGIEDASR
jgi:hypothetical protein